jgi:hypothetical protein
VLPSVAPIWLVKMEFVAGAPLAERLKPGPLPLATAIHVRGRSAPGWPHREGVVRRDLEPQNVMLEDSR